MAGEIERECLRRKAENERPYRWWSEYHPTALADAVRLESSTRALLEGLARTWPEAAAKGRLAQWRRAALSIIDLVTDPDELPSESRMSARPAPSSQETSE